ncbi:MAG: nitroreductase family protein [Amaricoccus sp.]|uniref:nitroreductase family protein n=1 Tax=Amaricoccus sp. TaxID=1872485 RepID=UPI0039E43975
MNQIARITARSPEHPVDALFTDRWSPRSFDGTPLSEAQILTILEAASWAPSAYNAQPWRFIYALKGTPEFDRLLGLLVEFNQSWAKEAGALVFIVSRTHLDAKDGAEAQPIYSHSFDAGAAWAQLALQAHLLGLHAHGMTGLDFARSPAALGLPEGYRVEAAVAIGTRADAGRLPEPLRARETPSPRKPLAEIAFRGSFSA